MSDGWKFKNVKSAMVTIGIIILLLVTFAGVSYSTEKKTMARNREKARESLSKLVVCMDDRFLFSLKLSTLVDDASLTRDIDKALAQYDKNDIKKASASYIALDKALLPLQKAVFPRSDYARLQPYFERLSSIEDELEPLVQQYNAYASHFNTDLISFMGKRIAAREGWVSLDLYGLSSVLASRP
ncbi:MAG: hypothetical protein WCR02_09260 [Sphaerochaetaceae bacterium]